MPIADTSTTAALGASDFRHLVEHYKDEQAERRAEARRLAADQHRKLVHDYIAHHVADPDWREMLHRAREAAEHGQAESLLLRFPSALCSDGGRAINVAEPSWPNTLRGEPAELYTRWEHDLKPRGFHLAARVLEFPNGFPGDIGLFLVWGE